jgi:DNA-binding protein HU-beta
MTKQQLIDVIASKTNLSKSDSTYALNAMTDAITSALASGNNVQLMDFGSFVMRVRAARTGRNPQTGETLQIKAYKVAAFKPSRHLKTVVNR